MLISDFDKELERIYSVHGKVLNHVLAGDTKPRLYGINTYNVDEDTDVELVWGTWEWDKKNSRYSEILSHSWDEGEEQAAISSLFCGQLVPTNTEAFANVSGLQRIQHFDDINWARYTNNEYGTRLIFALAADGDQDVIIDSLQGLRVHAFNRLEEVRKFNRESYGFTNDDMEDDPVKLSDGTEITPFLLKPDHIRLKKRQRALGLNQ